MKYVQQFIKEKIMSDPIVREQSAFSNLPYAMITIDKRRRKTKITIEAGKSIIELTNAGQTSNTSANELDEFFYTA